MEEYYRLSKADHVMACSKDGTASTTIGVEHVVTSAENSTCMFICPPFDDDHDDDEEDNEVGIRFDRMKASESKKISDLMIKTQIAKHPGYPDLVAAYIECQKVGAPPETASLLEEIRREKHTFGGCGSQIGADPELDNFMESYRQILQRFKDELSKPFNEATMFLSNIQSQLSNLCEDHEAVGANSYQEEMMGYREIDDEERPESCKQNSCGVGAAVDQQFELKEMLLKKYSGYVTMLKTEFLKKRKKVELPKPARAALLEWWNRHYIWPYPTEEEKVKLSAETGLDQKQINNWFVNQRKRHWKPTENIKSVLVAGHSQLRK